MKKHFFIGFIFALFAAGFCGAASFQNGMIRLDLSESSGRFLLYCKTGSSNTRYAPFFNDTDPRANFLQVSFNDRLYKLGDTSAFRSQTKKDADNPGFVFTSSFLSVVQDFTFIKTAGSSENNGVAVRITMLNLGRSSANVGFRLLLDTYLGERGSVHFVTDSQSVTAETLLERRISEKRWVSRGETSRGEKLSLMGSISVPGLPVPDAIHFANWQRLNDASWKLPYVQGRSFNSPPYSVRDSAVCYYFDPVSMNPGDSCSFVILLALEDEKGFLPFASPVQKASSTPQVPSPSAGNPSPSTGNPSPSTGNPSPSAGNLSPSTGTSAIAGSSPSAQTRSAQEQKQSDLELIRKLISQIDDLSVAENHNEEEIAALEKTLNELLIKYGFPVNPF
ncbi:MAG: hypothetical protein LBH43_11055 [Treponema sp.]|jgi:hypothetical protein|nr:hypothetical protein [Treponema sp.]